MVVGDLADDGEIQADVGDRDRALALHLVDEVTWPDGLLPRAVARARELGSRPADVYAGTKNRLHRPAVAR